MTTNRSTNSLFSLFNPNSIAVIGASSKPGKVGYEILKNIVEGGFKGGIYPVNPRGGEILSLETYRSVKEIKGEVDLAVIITPAETVPEIIDECGGKGVKAAVVISAGFSESGNLKLETKLRERVENSGLRVIGPNCAGIVNTSNNLYATMEIRVGKGEIGFITQSGALGGAILAWAKDKGIGMSKFVSYGNAVDVDETDLLEYLGEDQETKTIILYIEGVKNGRRFIEVARKVSMKKPIIAMKGGVTEMGSRAVQSHTGSLAGEGRIYLAAFKQSGLILAEDVHEFFDFSKVLTHCERMRGERVLVLTNSGGPAVMATDKLTELGLSVPEPPQELKSKLDFLPKYYSKRNPVDLTAEATAETYVKVLKTLFSTEFYHAALVICVPPFFLDSVEVAKAISEVRDEVKKPLIACWMSGELVKDAIPILEGKGIPNFPTPSRAAKAIWALYERSKFLARHLKQKTFKNLKGFRP